MHLVLPIVIAAFFGSVFGGGGTPHGIDVALVQQDLSDAGNRIATQCAEGYREYLPRAADRVHPYACPLASTRLKGLPPALMVSMEGDPLGDETTAYGEKLANAGVPVRTLVLSVPRSACSVSDPTARCRASFAERGWAEIADFVSSLSPAAP